VDALTADGHKGKAEALLRKLAVRAGAYSEPTDRLIFLWGPQPGRAALTWVVQNARQAKAPEERAEWLRRLTEIGGQRQAFAEIVRRADQATDREVKLAADLASQFRASAEVRAGIATLAASARSAVALKSVANAASGLNDKATAYRALRRAVQASPQEPELLRAYSFAASEVGQKQEAYSALARYVAVWPSDAEAAMDLGYSAQDMGRYQEAARAFDTAAVALRRARRDETMARIASAGALRRFGQTDDALAALSLLDRERPNDPRARAAYVEALLDAGKPEEARNALNR
jgi:Flp pilus assembly protein TadD